MPSNTARSKANFIFGISALEGPSLWMLPHSLIVVPEVDKIAIDSKWRQYPVIVVAAAADATINLRH